MRKLITILLITTFVALALVACTSTPVKTETPATDETEQTDTMITAPTVKPITITITDDTAKIYTPPTDAEQTDTPPVDTIEQTIVPTPSSNIIPPEDDFEDNMVLVGLTHEATMQNIDKEYTLEDFPEVDGISIIEMGPGLLKKVRAQIHGELVERERNLDTFTRMFSITLSKHDKENVKNACAILSAREDIHAAEPNIHFYIETTTVNDTLLPFQWG